MSVSEGKSFLVTIMKWRISGHTRIQAFIQVFKHLYCSNLQLVLCKRLTLSAALIFVIKCLFIYVLDQFGTLAQVGTSPNLGWPNKELRGSQPIYELFCPSWDPLGIPMKQSRVVMLVSFLEVQGNSKWRNVLLRNAAQ